MDQSNKKNSKHMESNRVQIKGLAKNIQDTLITT